MTKKNDGTILDMARDYQRIFGQKQWIMQFTFQIGLQQEVYEEKLHKKNEKEQSRAFPI